MSPEYAGVPLPATVKMEPFINTCRTTCAAKSGVDRMGASAVAIDSASALQGFGSPATKIDPPPMLVSDDIATL